MTRYYYTDNEGRDRESKREYERIPVLHSAVKLYIDQETGIVVSDIGKFERWIGESK